MKSKVGFKLGNWRGVTSLLMMAVCRVSYITTLIITLSLIHQTDGSSVTAGISRRAQIDPSCVCSPRSYEFTIDLSQDCETNGFAGQPGIGGTVCLFFSGDNDDVDVVVDDTWEVYEVAFTEIDKFASPINRVIFEGFLLNGDVISFESISASLDPDVPLSDQLDLVPVGVQVSLRAISAGGESVEQRVGWAYTNSCESLPTIEGESIGWIILVSR